MGLFLSWSKPIDSKYSEIDFAALKSLRKKWIKGKEFHHLASPISSTIKPTTSAATKPKSSIIKPQITSAANIGGQSYCCQVAKTPRRRWKSIYYMK